MGKYIINYGDDYYIMVSRARLYNALDSLLNFAEKKPAACDNKISIMLAEEDTFKLASKKE